MSADLALALWGPSPDGPVLAEKRRKPTFGIRPHFGLSFAQHDLPKPVVRSSGVARQVRAVTPHSAKLCLFIGFSSLYPKRERQVAVPAPRKARKPDRVTQVVSQTGRRGCPRRPVL